VSDVLFTVFCIILSPFGLVRLFVAVGKVSFNVNIVFSVSVVSAVIMMMSVGAMSSPVGVAVK
jgi:hypothetical protein